MSDSFIFSSIDFCTIGRRYLYSDFIIKNFTNFQITDEDFEVLCLKGKHWEVIKSDFENLIKKFTNKE